MLNVQVDNTVIKFPRIIRNYFICLLLISLSMIRVFGQTDSLLAIRDTSYFVSGDPDLNLIESVKRNEPGNVLLLLKEGADPNAKSEDNITALMYAIDSTSLLLMKLLLVNGSDPNLTYYDKTTPLILAVLNNQFEAAQLLLEKGADPDIIDDFKASALLYAAASNYFQIADLLIFYGADTEIADKDGNDPLMTAVTFDHIETTDVLLQNGLGPDTRDKNGNTPLMVAAQNGDTAIADILLEYGAELNTVNISNYSPLTFAILYQHPEMVKLLIDKGADVNHRVTSNRTQLDMARQINTPEIEKMLKEKGATRTVKPDFSEVALSWGNSVSGHEWMMQVRGAWIDRRYGFYAETGVDWRPILQTIQTRENDSLIYQYRESRTGWSHGIGKKFAFRPNNAAIEYGFYGSLTGLLSFASYKGLKESPPVQYNLIPAAGIYCRWRFAGIKMGFERYNFKTIYEKSWKFNCTLYLRFSYDNIRKDYKEIYY